MALPFKLKKSILGKKKKKKTIMKKNSERNQNPSSYHNSVN
jgi:hypothetical protein